MSLAPIAFTHRIVILFQRLGRQTRPHGREQLGEDRLACVVVLSGVLEARNGYDEVFNPESDDLTALALDEAAHVDLGDG